MPTQRPNIVMIMADQLAAPALPCYGHPVVKTPHLDALARNGVVFENAYCNSPLCGPSRASLMTGQLPSRIGAYDNATSFPPDVPTIAHHLRAAGYSTCLAGKMHFVGPDQLHGFEERLTTDIYPADYGWTPDWETFEERPSWYHNMLSVVQAGVCVTSNQLDYDDEVGFQTLRHIHNLARRDDKRPFFLLASFTHPHDPYTITREYWERYESAEIDLPAVPQQPYDELDPHSQRLHHVCALGDYAQTEERIRNARRAYYGEISYIDDKVGQILQTLEETGLSENTIIIFVADHGDMLGERGMWFKMSFFEWSARVPMIFYGPNRFTPGRVQQPVSLVDLLPTLTELAAADTPPSGIAPLDGHSLLPRLEGNALADAPPVYGEMLAEGAIAPLLMIRRGRHKYIACSTDPEQLYDLDADPNELNNLADLPDFQPLLQSFRSEAETRWDATALHAQVLASQRRRKLIDNAMTRGKHTSWDFQPQDDASKKYMRNHLDLNELERTARYPSPATPPAD